MNVLVTGANGHVGANLVRALLARGDRVRALVRSRQDAIDGLPIEIVRGDVRDPDAMRHAMQGVEVVFHFAAIISIDGPRGGHVESVNVEGTRTVAEAALAAGVGRFVHCSSIHAFGDRSVGARIDEASAPLSDARAPAYDRSKAAGEAAVLELAAEGLDVVIVHPTGVIGPNDFGPSRMGRVLLDLARGRMPSLVRGSFDWVDVRDVAAGAIAAAERGGSGERYLLGGHRSGLVELAEVAAAVTGIPRPRMVLPLRVGELAAPFGLASARMLRREPMFTPESMMPLRWDPVVIRDKAGAELGYAPRPLEETVADTISWFAETGLLSPTKILADRLERR